jgi:protocatechuate 3,4-dioxygenase beta subunit
VNRKVFFQKFIHYQFVAGSMVLLLLTACANQPVETDDNSTIPKQSERASAVPTLLVEVTEVDLPQAATEIEQIPVEEWPVLACTPPAPATLPMTEGPFYKSGAPERDSLLEPDMPGTKLTLKGYVLDTDCQPIANASLDFWQADDSGAYDNQGYDLRGVVATDEQGRYRIETILPGLYPGRTAHIHVKVQPPGGAELTTQLFFPDVAGNQTDRIFSPQLVTSLQDIPDGKLGTFIFVLNRP